MNRMQIRGEPMRHECIEAANAELLKKIQQLDAALVSSVRTDNSQVIVNLEKKIATLKREITLKQKQHAEQGRKYREKIRTCNSENARLKAALKPVLEFMPYDVWPNEEVMLHRAFAVTEEAKRIYNEGREEAK